MSFWRKCASVASMPVILGDYFAAETGKECGAGFFAKLKLLRRMRKNRKLIPTASHFVEHLVMATEILKLPRSVEGCVVECGCFKGGSSANLSLVCALCERDLEIFDSFAGLPAPTEADRQHVLVGSREIHTYEKGAFCGTLAEVKENVRRHGAIGRCNFHAGFFENTLPGFQRACVLVFVDVDLVDSLRTCMKYLWPQLADGCRLFTHEAAHAEMAAQFFDQQWWRTNLDCDAPGLVGAGTGLGLQPAAGGFRSDLGYAVKNPQRATFRSSAQTGEL